MNKTELNKYKAMLEARRADVSAGLRNREDIAIEKTPDALDEVQLALTGELHLIQGVRGFFNGDVFPVTEPGGNVGPPGFQHRFIFVEFGLVHGSISKSAGAFCFNFVVFSPISSATI